MPRTVFVIEIGDFNGSQPPRRIQVNARVEVFAPFYQSTGERDIESEGRAKRIAEDIESAIVRIIRMHEA